MLSPIFPILSLNLFHLLNYKLKTLWVVNDSIFCNALHIFFMLYILLIMRVVITYIFLKGKYGHHNCHLATLPFVFLIMHTGGRVTKITWPLPSVLILIFFHIAHLFFLYVLIYSSASFSHPHLWSPPEGQAASLFFTELLRKISVCVCLIGLTTALKQGFSASALLTLGAAYFFFIEESCPVYCRMFSSISGPYRLDVKSTPHPTPLTSEDNQKCLQMLPTIPLGNLCEEETYCDKVKLFFSVCHIAGIKQSKNVINMKWELY